MGRMGRIAVAYVVLAGFACKENGASRPDGSPDGGKLDVGTTLTLQISVSGCAAFDPAGSCNPNAATAPCCTGSPPLALSFAPIGSQELTRFQWDFGDGTATSDERAPTHSYAHPGRYQVTLIGGASGSGTVNPGEELTVIVEPLAAGLPCDVDAQCGAGLSCLCAPGNGCGPAFLRGICSAACDSNACGSGAVCAATAFTPAADGGTGASVPRCLAACQTNAACAPGFVCMTLPAGPTAATAPWTHGCLPIGAARDVGASCRDANGVLANALCTTRLCADVGALGVCSAACDAGVPCPEGTTCAVLSGGRQLCLARCNAGADCAHDPLLACDPARPPGDMDPVCRPRTCSNDAACAPSGRCGPDGTCIPR